MPGDPTTPPRVPDKAPTPPAVGSVRPWWRGWPLPWMSLLVTALVAGTAGGWWLTRQAQAPQGRDAILHCALPAQAADAPHPGMVWVPAGRFAFGDTVYPEEQPVRMTRVDGFWMDRTEVSNDAFAAFVDATGYVTVAERPVDAARYPDLPPDMRQPGAVVFTMPGTGGAGGGPMPWWRYVPGANWRHPGGPGTGIAGRGAFPVVAVTIEDAQAYARWKGRNLPTEVQWEWAAQLERAGSAGAHDQPADANTWQGLFPVANSGEDGFVGLAPVGCYPPNRRGLFDMLGNVWELTTDRWTASHDAPPQVEGHDPAAPLLRAGAPAQRVIKGGSFLCAPNYCMRYRAGARQPQDDDLAVSHLGFRTILLAPGPSPQATP
ncbi:MAG: SUMF1/EgtB/PvdO family nonheme iron enzyme [Burkholderiaceae bacterium]